MGFKPSVELLRHFAQECDPATVPAELISKIVFTNEDGMKVVLRGARNVAAFRAGAFPMADQAVFSMDLTKLTEAITTEVEVQMGHVAALLGWMPQSRAQAALPPPDQA